MRNFLLVGAGGFLGSLARYYATGVALSLSAGARFPYGTLLVNVVGSALIGALGGLAETRGILGAPTRLFLFTGVLGGFTTFSAFTFETHYLIRTHAWTSAALNVALQLVCGFTAVWAGYQLATALPR